LPDISHLVIQIDSNGVVQAFGNFGKFVEASEKARKSASALEKSMGGLGKEFASFNLIAGRLPGPLKDIASGILGMVNPATAATGAILAIGKALVDFGKYSVHSYGQMETIKVGLEVVTGSAEKANTIFQQLKEFDAISPFDLPTLTNAATMLLQTGTTAKELLPTIKMIGEAARGSSDLLNRIAINWGQIQNSPTGATAMDIRQFTMMGIPITQMMKEMGTQGKLTGDQMVEAFRRMTEAGGVFYKSTELGSQTVEGRTAQLKAAWTSFAATFADVTGLGEGWKLFLSDLTGGVKSLTNALENYKSVKDQLEALTERSGRITIDFPSMETAEEFTDRLNEANKPFNDIIEKVTAAFQDTSQYKDQEREKQIRDWTEIRDSLYTITNLKNPFTMETETITKSLPDDIKAMINAIYDKCYYRTTRERPQQNKTRAHRLAATS
jgi:hypothetical protein